MRPLLQWIFFAFVILQCVLLLRTMDNIVHPAYPLAVIVVFVADTFLFRLIQGGRNE